MERSWTSLGGRNCTVSFSGKDTPVLVFETRDFTLTASYAGLAHNLEELQDEELQWHFTRPRMVDGILRYARNLIDQGFVGWADEELSSLLEDVESFPGDDPTVSALKHRLVRTNASLRQGDERLAISYLESAIDIVFEWGDDRMTIDFKPHWSWHDDPPRSDIHVVADLDVVASEVIVELIAALDEIHRAHGGGGLEIRSAHTGSAAFAGVSA
jgi:hypothetical protein